MSLTVQDVINVLPLSSGPEGSTVDGLITGNLNQKVQGVAVTFVASHETIEKAAQLGANLFITHEGVFYEHHGSRAEKELTNPVISRKKEQIKSHQMILYRYHDGPHQAVPDIITHGLLQALEWDTYQYSHLKYACLVTLPEPLSVQQIVQHLKDRLVLPYVRFAGDSEQKCSEIALTAGYRGGSNIALPLFTEQRIDLLIAGEGPEWETPEYVQDAVSQGSPQAQILIGHAASEEPGMKAVAQQIRDHFPDLPVYFIPASPVIKVL